MNDSDDELFTDPNAQPMDTNWDVVDREDGYQYQRYDILTFLYKHVKSSIGQCIRSVALRVAFSLIHFS